MQDKKTTPPPLHVALATYLLLSLFADLQGRLVPLEPPGRVLATFARHRESLDPRTMNARELRRLPGVGRVRAEAVVEAREGQGARGALRWDDVPGIGVVTRRRIEAWLVERGVDPTLPLAGEGGGGGGEGP